MGPDLIYETKFTWKEALPVARTITLDNMKEYEKNLFRNTFLEAMVYGDFDKKDAMRVVSLFKDKTKTKPIEKEKNVRSR